MSNLGWAPALIITIGAMLVLCGLVAVGAEWLLAVRQNKRRNRRLQDHGYRFSTKDFKP